MPKNVNKAEVRQLIAETTLRFIAENGMEAISMRNIANAAGISSIQYYFQTKEALLHHAFELMNELARGRIETRLKLLINITPLNIITEVLHEFLPLDENRKELSLVLTAYTAYAATHEGFLDIEGAQQLEQWVVELLRPVAGTLSEGALQYEGKSLLLITDGLRADMLLGIKSEQEALCILSYHIDRICTPGEGVVFTIQ